MTLTTVSSIPPTGKTNNFISEPVPLTPLQLSHESSCKNTGFNNETKHDFTNLKNTHTYAKENEKLDLNKWRIELGKTNRVKSHNNVSSCAIIITIFVFIMYMNVLILPDLHETLKLTKTNEKHISQILGLTLQNCTC
jgi:hypothetical protein